MIEFKPLTLEDKEIFLKYLGTYNFFTYEYSFVNLYLWRNYSNVEYAIIKDILIVKKTEEKIGTYFLQPIGYSHTKLEEIISELIKIKQNDSNIKCLFRNVEEPFLLNLQEIYGTKIIYCVDVKNFDYIYESKKLINLTGEKLKKRKNLYNQFINKYNYTLRDIHAKEVIEDCLSFSRLWFESQKNKNWLTISEVKGIRDILTNIDYLNVMGMAVYVGNTIAGFTIGEKVNGRMAIIHIEKGDIRYKGIYAFINKTFAEKYLKEVTYINRQEDMGIAGLRKAKQAYDPVKLEKKYIVDLL